ncbi:MAG: iron donor protein CyaY [Porticoccaceae bacterium]|nr:iron donor protein CyaY [Porticoccaceae bacterium]
MNETEYRQRVDELIYQIEQQIDDSGIDVDYENTGGMLTITVESNASQIILSRQVATREVWLADRSGGFHFVLKGEAWRDTQSGELLSDMLSQAFMAQASESLAFSL